ncbi:MAG: hypothetical protein P1V51_02480 [Deltaproteobacteria bacterium]|nr:hypothetical protein [Deltaproteobacteria bacterium]
MRFLVTYSDPDELLADHEAQLSKGGFLVRVDPPPGAELYADARLTFRLGPDEAVLEGTVMQVLPGAGVAVGFEASEELAALLEAARARTGAGGSPAVHALQEEGDAEEEALEAEDEGAESGRARGPTRAEQIRKARAGDRGEREAAIREGDGALQRFVLMNPGITLAEVKFIASMSRATAPSLKTISERREWISRPEIAMALLRNPKTPVPVAIKMIPLVNFGELRVLVRGGHLRTPILNAARKRKS